MEIKWTTKAASDVARLFDFLSPSNARTAKQIVRALVAAPTKLVEYPRLGEKLEEFEPREVRRILVGHYEMRYEVAGPNIFILRIWHSREDR